jgi:hypothetical protein
MNRLEIIERTISIMRQLPDEKAEEISDFADFILKRYEEQLLTNGIQHLAAESRAFEFLDNEEDIYHVSDLKEVYNG